MKFNRPGILSVRAVNQYRRREILSYLGLRYYLDNSSARSDHWAKVVTVHNILNRNTANLFKVQHFKKRTANGNIEYRDMFLPGPVEALAEAVLLDECAHSNVFNNPSCVFSYSLNKGNGRDGIFSHYIHGLRERQKAIAKACEFFPDGIVCYTDIKHFYTSISLDRAQESWLYFSEKGKLKNRIQELGLALIEGQKSNPFNSAKTLLIGPMFSHLIANLVLRELDELSCRLPAQYVRYVDDISLIGNIDSVEKSRVIIRSHLEKLKFNLHDESSDKFLVVPSKEWLKGRDDFCQTPDIYSWESFIGDLKRFLLLQPDKWQELKTQLLNEGFRIPIADYSCAIYERSYVERLSQLVRQNWLRKKIREVTIDSIVRYGKLLRDRYINNIVKIIDETINSTGYSRKRAIPTLRYRLSRLIFLASDSLLSNLSEKTKAIPELYLLSEVKGAVASGNLDRILPLGTNAAQAAAQPLRVTGKHCSLINQNLSDIAQQSLSIFLLNGVALNSKMQQKNNDLMRFALKGSDIGLMKKSEPFIRELACLHGISDYPRHPTILETAYDEDEILAIDIIDQLQYSPS